MLVISQKKGETIHIGRDITVTILETSSGRVRLGIKAPKDVKVTRDNLFNAKEHSHSKKSMTQEESEDKPD